MFMSWWRLFRKKSLYAASDGKLTIIFGANQYPKPGYCTITDDADRVKFQLYFDGGTERKLQIKRLKKVFCVVHATWKFEPGLAGPYIEEGIAIP